MSHFFKLRYTFALLAMLISFSALAQQPLSNIIASKKTSDGRYHFMKLDASKQNQPSNLSQPEQMKSLLGLGARHSFALNETINSNAGFKRDNQGANHVRYQQYFNRIKVEFADVTLHLKNGSLNLLTGEYFNIPEGLSTIPALSEKAALGKAISFIGAKKYSWEDTSFRNSSLKAMPKGELVICKNFIAEANNPGAIPQMELAYKFAVYATEPLRYDFIYVGAQTGNILLDNPIIKHTNGTGATRYSGSRTIATTQLSASNYILKDSGANYNIATYNMGRGTSYNAATNFADNDNNWTAAEYNNSNYDNAALDAHWGAMMTQDYWRTVHGRNSFDNKGSKINSYVHYANLYANAYWDGVEMTYGDGDGSTMGPLTSVDICGHEIGHAVCQYTANLIYSNESGAINEGFSDIWGACIKRYADASKNTWLAGDEIYTNGNAIRSLSNPKSHTQPDTYKGSYWYTGTGDNGGVHYNSGIMNYWFYLLTQGKSGTNDNGKAYNVSGIGITKAAQIAYRAESVYMFPAAAYADTRVLTIQAAEDLFGAGSNEVIQTTAAWNATGVYDALAKPDSVTATLANNAVTINWRLVSTQSIDGFKIERAVNGLNNFAAIASVNGSTRSFTDTGFLNNSLNQYRVRSFRGDSLYSDYSATASVAAGNAPLIMTNGSYTTCGATFFDPGGQGNYPSGSYTMTIRPGTAGNKLQIAFSLFSTNDYLYIYNGPTTSSPLLGTYYGTSLPPVLQSTAAGGELTFVFNPYNSGYYPGWKASVSCYKPVTAPTNLTGSTGVLRRVNLNWKDNATDEDRYVVERAINDSTNYVSLVSLAPNTTSFIDSSAPDNSYVFYRVKAYRDTVGSPYSNQVAVTIGNLYTMQNGSVTTCGIIFLDPGGAGNYSYGNYTTTFRPATAANKLKVAFSQFNVYYDNLYIYNGPSSSSPLLGSYSGTTFPPALQSTAAGGELTFVFNAYYSNSAPGWLASVSCYKPVGTPTNLTAARSNVKDVQLTWADNASDETGYVVERSLTDSLHFLSLATFPANTTGYSDTSAPLNSSVFYRVKAYRDSVSSPYSNTLPFFNGNNYVMQNGSYTGCDYTFLDPGGIGNYNTGYYTTTLKPATPGNNLQVAFRQFSTSYDNLYIYNGPSSSYPLLGVYSGTNLPPVLQSTAPGGELTFVFNPYYANNFLGWVANITCYKTVLRPSGTKASQENLSRVKVTWLDNADDETKYIIERSVNASGQYKRVAELPANTTEYIDSVAPANSQLYFRVRAYRDTLASLYSDTAAVSFGNAPYFMKDSTVVTCDKVFMDPGGADIIPQNGSYSTYYNLSSTFKPAVSGNNVKVTFSSFKLNGGLYVYNGSSSSSPLIGSYSSYYNTPNINSLNFSGTGADGSLTFVYQGYSNGDSGWVAQVSCYKPVAKPSGIKATVNSGQKVVVNWTDNADDETKYVIERSVNASSLFARVADLPSNTTQFTDSSAPLNSSLYYRLKAYRDTLGSFYSDTALVSFGNVPFLMKDSTLITCDKVFMDPGGADVTAYGTYYKTATFKPAISGNNIKVTFSKFNNGNGTLTVYNGPSSNSPFIGSYSYSYSPGIVSGTGTDGSITFVYSSSYSFDSGWVAQVSCYKPVAKPSRVTAAEDATKKVKITWADNADNETKYVVERSVNGVSQFIAVGEVPTNNTVYFDTSAPSNNLLYYRVRGYQDSTVSFYSDTASIALGNAPFLMKDTIVVTCDKVFMDPAGADKIQRINDGYINIKTTFKPAINGNNIKVTFSQYQLSGTLSVYDGSSTSSPLIGNFTYYTGSPHVLSATNPEGTLTFVLTGYVNNDSGWVAQVSCYKPVAKPTGLTTINNGSKQIGLTWTDNADDETKYIVERSVNAPSLYSVVGQLPSGTTNFTDSFVPANSLIFYRVRAYRDTLGSNYSDTASVAVGDAPFLMKDSTLISCSKVFLDPGGVDVVPSDYYYRRATFKSATAGNNVRVVFSKFQINGSLSVYDGPSTNSRLIGTYTGYISYPLTFEGTGTDGSLTFYYQSNRYTDSGWVAQVSCYKPVAKPNGLKAVPDNSGLMKLTWTDNADDETRYVVERSVNASTLFARVAQLPANTTQYTDSTTPANNFLYYRVRAYRDTLGSVYSDTAYFALGNVPFFMKDSTLITCNKVFMDAGGADVIPPNYYGRKSTTTFKPGVSGNKIKVAFTKMKPGGNPLYVYDGSSINSSLLATIYYYTPFPLVYRATNPEGSLTFSYQNSYYGDSGWVAQVSCFKPIIPPGNLTADTAGATSVRLKWIDNANNEASYVVEKSVTDSLHFQPLVSLPANTTAYIDTAAPGSNFIFYRVAAYIDSSSFEYSNNASVITGVPFVMQNTTISTCGVVFLDPGGTGNYNSGNYTATVKPATAGNVVRVQFGQFNTYYDNLYVYDGPSTSSPRLGYYYGTALPPVLQSSAPGGELTFQFNSYYSNTYPGWTAYLSCYKPVLKPSGMKAVADTSSKINLTWSDNANDETKYVVERSVNAPSLFTFLKELPANTTLFTDSAAPFNSVVYYRVKAYRDTAGSAYSDTATLSLGNAPFIMKDTVLVTCNKIFLDPGGMDIIPNATNSNTITTTTFKPAVAGNNIRVAFSSLKFGAYLYVYNGSSANSPLITTLSYYSGPLPVFNSTAADGSLTFAYRQYAYGDSGWVAQVSCYKPVAKPIGIKAIADTSSGVKLIWTDNADDETKYVVERSVNAPSQFKVLAQLPANTVQYTDSSAPANSLLFYRVKAYRDTLGSLYSDTASIAFGNAPFLMKDSTLITCNKVFMDPAGEDAILGNTTYNTITTFKPGTPGNNIQVAFSKLNIGGSIYVYNGSSVNNAQIGYLSRYSNPLSVFASTAADGSLTFRYYSSNYADSGWVAQVSCVKVVAKPSGTKALADSVKGVKVTWNDNANDETKYVVERSINAPSKYIVIAQLPSNTTQFTDSAAPANSFLLYRIRAYRDSLYSFYSDTATISFGNAPYLMKDSTVITCNKVFMDAGGTDIIPTGNYYNTRTTFKPGSPVNTIKVVFSKFSLYGYLYVYNGLSASSPLIGSYGGSSYNTYNSLAFNSTAPDGALTFVYQGSTNNDSGWVAQVSCVKGVAKPSGIKATADSSQPVRLSWTDNADDETKYVVERAVNSPSKYAVIAQLPANAIQYTDSTVPPNSELFYRVRAYRDTLGSFYSDTATIDVGNAPCLMKSNGTIITCDKVFLSPGGLDVIPTGFFTYQTTFKPAVDGNNIKVNFSKLKITGYLYIYNGSSTNNNLIAAGISGYYTSPMIFNSTAADGALTIVYKSNSYSYSYPDSGWLANVSCYKPVTAPGNLTATANNSKLVQLNWVDSASDETNYVIERSFNDVSGFLPLKTLPANTTSYTDTTAPANSFIFYRVVALRDSVASPYSNVASALNGTIFTMRSGTLKACGITFLDPGGAADYGNNANYTTTFAPAESGKKTRVTFSTFSTESCCDYLNVYNGPGISSPLVGTYLGSALPPVLQSTAPGGELTFRFITDGAVTGPGWNAIIDCIKTSDTLVSCSTDSNEINTITSNITGNGYQWQKYNGTAYVTMTDDLNNTGTNTPALNLKNAGLSAFEKYRCLVSGSLSAEYVVMKGNRWTGNVSSAWTDSKNWSCGVVPDSNTDVLIEGGMTNSPVVNGNGECRSIKVMPGATIEVMPGFILNVRH